MSMGPQHATICVVLLVLPGALAGALRTVSLSDAVLPSFDAFLLQQGRSYAHGSAEYTERRSLYEARVKSAALHNSQKERLWTAAANQFWDWTDAELRTLRGWQAGARPSQSSARLALAHRSGLLRNGTAADTKSILNATSKAKLPVSKHWGELEAIRGKVHNQGGCGSCWAVAAAQTLTAHHEIHMGKVRRFSVQQILACTPNPQHCGGEGYCKGATVELAMDWVMANGCETEGEAPYLSARGDTPACSPPAALVAKDRQSGKGAAEFGMHGWERLPENKYEPLMNALVNAGPVAVSVAANGWINYGTGIYDACVKDAIIDHAVVMVGYGVQDQTKYWQIQNSWGGMWGEMGKMRLIRHDDEEGWCGIDNKPELGTGCIGGPPQVTVCGTCGILYDSVIPHFGSFAK